MASFCGGETGCQSYLAAATASCDGASEPNDQLYGALFGLARLFLTPTFAPWAAEMLAANDGDFFIPCLMLLEAVHRQSVSDSPGTAGDATTKAVASAEDVEQGELAVL